MSRSGIVHCLLRPTADETEQPDYREDDNDDDDDKQPTDEDAPPITGLLLVSSLCDFLSAGRGR